MIRKCLIVGILLIAPRAAHAQSAEHIDSAINARIRIEGLQHSQVVTYFDHLTNVIGPRLTGSPGFHAAIDWSVAQLKGLGLSGVHMNRCIQALRGTQAVVWQGNRITINNWDELAEFAEFDPAYLGLEMRQN